MATGQNNSNDTNHMDNAFQSVATKRPCMPSTERDPRLKFPRTSAVSNNIVLQNRFEVLSNVNVNEPGNDGTSCTEQNSIENKRKDSVKRPPPIYVSDITNYENLIRHLNSISGSDTFKCKSTPNNTIIYPSTPDLYRAIVKSFRDTNIRFHTYQLQEDKANRVVIRGLHHTTPVDAISTALVQLGFSVRSVVNVISYNKMPLPMFFVDLEHSDKNDEIYKLETLLHSVIRVEEPRRRRALVQCMRCQNYGHTKAYCNLVPRCVRCGESHSSTDCNKSRNTPAKCALCSGDHPSNYRGCRVHKNLQNLRSPSSSEKRSTNVPQSNLRPFTANDFPSLPKSDNLPVFKTVTENSKSYSNIVNGEHSPEMWTTVQNTMSQFFIEIKNLITPLVTLMTQLTSILCKHVS